MAITNVGLSLPSVAAVAATDGGRLPFAGSNRAQGSALPKAAPQEPPQVLRTSVSLHSDDRLGGLNNMVAKIIDPEKKQWSRKFHRNGRLIYRSNCVH